MAASLVEILHAGVVVATHAQRLRGDQANRAPGHRRPATPETRPPGDGDQARRGRRSGQLVPRGQGIWVLRGWHPSRVDRAAVSWLKV